MCNEFTSRQRAKLAAQERDEEVAWLLREWEAVLNDLDRDVGLCRDRVDWVAKKQLLEALLNEEQLSWTDPWLQSIDLEYHNIAPEAGLYYELICQGAMRRFVAEAKIKHAIFAPPEDTRAYFRGRSVARFDSQIKSIQWDEIVFADGAVPQRVQLAHPNDNPRLAALNKAAREAADYRHFIRTVAAL